MARFLSVAGVLPAFLAHPYVVASVCKIPATSTSHFATAPRRRPLPGPGPADQPSILAFSGAANQLMSVEVDAEPAVGAADC